VEAHPAELDDIAVAQGRGVHPAAADDHAVERAVVEDPGAVVVMDDEGVTARHGRVVECEAGRWAAADVERTSGQRDEDDLRAVLDGEVLAEVEGGKGPEGVAAVTLIEDSGGGHGDSPHPRPERALTAS